MRYSKKTVLDYIAGDDLVGYSIDELEDNPSFMADVMELTMDKKIYNLCSENVKNNHEFVKRIVTKFKKDSEFITKVVDNYLDNCNDEMNKAEINILVGNIFDETDNPDLLEYKVSGILFYESVILEMELLLANLNENERNMFGKGFYVIETVYQESDIIKNHIAKIMIEDAFYNDERYNFEEILHLNFKAKEDLENFGETKFLISYISNVDSALGDYLALSKELLLDLKKNLDSIKRRWSTYIDTLNKTKLEIVSDEVYNYQEKNMPIHRLDYEECIGEIMTKLGIQELFEKYKLLDEELFNEDDISNLETDDFYIDEEDIYEELPENCLIMEREKFVRHMTAYIKHLFSYDVVPNDEYDDLIEQDEKENINEEETTDKIIRVDFKNGKVIKKQKTIE